MVDRLGAHPVPDPAAIGAGVLSDFEGVIDLVEMKAIPYRDELGTNRTSSTSLRRRADEAGRARAPARRGLPLRRRAARDCIARGGRVPPGTLKAIRKATLQTNLPPCCADPHSDQRRAAAPGRGGRLPALAAGRAPGDRHRTDKRATEHEREVMRTADDGEPFSALAFKIAADPYVGKLTYFRVYSGQLEAGSRVLNVNTGRTERVGRILMMHANDREESGRSTPATSPPPSGVKQVITGDTSPHPDAPVASRHHFPRARHKGGGGASHEGRPGEDVDGPRGASLRRTQRSRCAPTKRPARPRYRAWASCT